MVKVSRRSQIAPFEVMEVLDRVTTLRAGGRDILSLCAGEPSGGAPTDVRERAARTFSASGGSLGYTSALDMSALETPREIDVGALTADVNITCDVDWKETAVPVPLPDGYVLSLAFPSYERRPNQVKASSLCARSASGQLYAAESEPVEDICAIAEQNLDNRRVRVIAKMLVTAGGKYALEKAAERRIAETRGENTAIGFRILSSLYNIFSNRADLRCWQTLPAEIRAARLLLEPGVYDIFVETSDGGARRLGGIELGRFNLSAGEKKFLVVSTWE